MIYFIKSPDGPIKIGTTIRLSERLKELVAEHGEGLEVLAVVDGSFDDERELHGRFAHLRRVGEWFEPGDDLVGFIVAEGKPWDEAPMKPVRLDLTSDVHRMLRLVAAHEGASMASYARDALAAHLVEEIKRRGLGVR